MGKIEMWKHWQNVKKRVQNLEMRDLQYGRWKLKACMDMQGSVGKDKLEVGYSGGKMERRKRECRLSPTD